MPKLHIDNHEVQVPEGATILDAATMLGIRIPTLCFAHKHAPEASCMVCAVRVDTVPARLVPACATRALDGMQVESDTPEIRDARKLALELLLSEHVGDCIAPCESVCPAHLNIPLMLRQIKSGHYQHAIATIKQHIALPATLGRICAAPCEKACRRGILKTGDNRSPEKPVSICRLKRFAADIDLAAAQPYLLECKVLSGCKVAIIGAGPTGLAAAQRLAVHGHRCTVFDKHAKPGGALRSVATHILPADVLDAEISLIARLAVNFQLNCVVGVDIAFPTLVAEYDAVLLATGSAADISKIQAQAIALDSRAIVIDKATGTTNIDGVFAAAGSTAAAKSAVAALAAGNAAADAINRYLCGQPQTTLLRPFSVHIGKLSATEAEAFLAQASRASRIEPTHPTAGYTAEAAAAESARCVHCDCRKRHACKLREHAQNFGVQRNKYNSSRRAVQFDHTHPDLVHEPGKCIACGVCIRIAAESREKPGLAFVGRGFDVKVAVPLGGQLVDALHIATARECAKACPTGALALAADRI